MARQHRDGWQADVIQDGKRIRRQFPTQIAAELWESTQGDVTPSTPRLTLTDYAKPRIDMIWDRGSKHGQKQFIAIQYIQKFMDCAMEDITQVKVNDLISHLQKQRDAGGTINRKLAALSKVIKHAKFEGAYDKEVPRFTRQKEPRGRIRYLEWDEEAKLSNELSKYNPRYPDFVAFMCDTGVRCSNGTNLLWRDVKLPPKGSNQRGMITLWGDTTKPGEHQSIPLSVRAVKALERQKALSPADTGPFQWLNPWTLRGYIKGAAEAAGLGSDIVIHTFRHTCASRLVMKGIDLRRVQLFMGHKTLAMTLKYAHLAPEALESCADALDTMGV